MLGEVAVTPPQPTCSHELWHSHLPARSAARGKAAARCNKCRASSIKSSSSSSTATSKQAAAKAAESLPLEYLDWRFLSSTYEASTLPAEPQRSPSLMDLNQHILTRLHACTSIGQVERLVEVELPSMHAGSCASALKLLSRLARASMQGAALTKGSQDSSSTITSTTTSSSSSTTTTTTSSSSSSRGDLSHPPVAVLTPSGPTPEQQQLAGPPPPAPSPPVHPAAPADQYTLTSIAPGLALRLVGRLVTLSQQQQGVTISHCIVAIHSLAQVHRAVKAMPPPSPARQDLGGSRPPPPPPPSPPPTPHSSPPSHSHPSALEQARWLGEMSLLALALAQHCQAALFMVHAGCLGRLAHDLAHLGLRPDPDWLTHFCLVSQAKLPLMTPHQLAALAGGLARLDHLPGELWLSSLAECSRPALNLMQPDHLAHLLWAWSHWKRDPGPGWRDTACQVLGAGMERMDASSLTACLHALLHLGHTPDHSWMLVALQRLVQVQGQCTPWQIAEVLHAIAASSWTPPQAAMEELVELQARRLHTFPPDCLTLCMWALARLGYRPSQPWLKAWQAASLPQMRGIGAVGLTTAFVAFGRWQVRPSKHWLQPAWERAVGLAWPETMQPIDALRMLAAHTYFRLPPPRALLKGLVAVLAATPTLQDKATSIQQPPTTPSAQGPALAVGNNSTHSVSQGGVSVLSDGHDGPTRIAAVPAAARVGRARVTARSARPGTSDGDLANDLADAVILLPQLLALYDASLVSATTSSAVKTAAEHGLAEVAASIKNSGRHGRKARETGKPGVAGIGLQQPLPRQLSPSAAQGFLVHPSAETVALIPAESLNALLTTLRSRLVFLDARRLYLVLKALAQMRLHPGRVFLAAHLQALTPLMRNISLGDKERINKGYAVLSEAKSAPLLRIQRSSAHRIVQATPFRKIPGRPLYRLDDEVEVTSSRLGESAQPSVKPHAKHRRDGRAEGGRQAGDTRRQLNKSPAESTDGDAKRSALTTKGVSNARQRLWAVSK